MGGGETERLVEAAQRGDQEAARALFAGVEERVLGIVRRRLGARLRGRLESLDVAQSALGDALRDLERFEYRGEGALVAWLARVVENKLRREARAHAVAPEPLPTSVGDGGPSDPRPSPPSDVGRRDEREQVLAAIARLPARQRLLLRLRDLEGRSWSEVVVRAGEPSIKAAQQAHARARVRLAALLADRRDRVGGPPETREERSTSHDSKR